jgi:putative Holliday junction resolvase
MTRILGLDIGERRIGVAVSDPTKTLARPVTTVVRASREADFHAISRLIKEYDVDRVIVGLPLSLDGTEGPQAQRIRRYAKRLEAQVAVPLGFWDERYSTVMAAEILGTKGRRGRKAREEIDATAAAVILQSYLDAHSSAMGL